MSFSAQASRSLDAALQENSRIYPIGVSRYDAFPNVPVRSATRAAFCWLLQGLRVGISPYSNPLAVEEANASTFQTMLAELLNQSELSTAEKQGLQAVLQGASAGWNLNPPTFHTLLSDLIFLGNHLEWNKKCRLLVPFIGHGTLCQGRMVLCPSDTQPNPTIATNRAEALIKAVENRNIDWGTQFRVLAHQMLGIAAQKGILAEVLDVLAVSSETLGTRYAGPVILDMVRFHKKNLERIPNLGKRTPPEWGNVISPIHWMLIFGPHDARVTLILDACHAGGPSDTLQGSQSAHDWTRLGVGSRIYSASQKAQQAAETRLGDRRLPVATWALTTVLSRWEAVADGPAYAVGIRNGDLVLRANLLLEALSFTQQISLHAPVSKIAASDMPFFGLYPETRTTTDPTTTSDGIQLSSDTPGITNHISLWQIRQAGILKASLLAIGSNAAAWSHNNKTYYPNKLYIFSTVENVQQLANHPGFTMSMVDWNGSGTPPTPLLMGIDTFGNAPLKEVLASGDPGEQSYAGPPNPGGVVAWQGSGRKVYLRWVAPNNDHGKLHFISKAGFPYNPGDFAADGMNFVLDNNPGFSNTCMAHLIVL